MELTSCSRNKDLLQRRRPKSNNEIVSPLSQDECGKTPRPVVATVPQSRPLIPYTTRKVFLPSPTAPPDLAGLIASAIYLANRSKWRGTG